MKTIIGVLALAFAAPVAAHGATGDHRSGEAHHGFAHGAQPAAKEHDGHEPDCAGCCERMRRQEGWAVCNRPRDGAEEASSDHAQHGGG
jgi:hypothetical protein